MVYVLVVTPSGAVTTMGIVFDPTLNAMGADADPDIVVDPFTIIVELAPWVAVGVTVMELTPFKTLAVYEVVDEMKDGARIPELTARPERDASLDEANSL